MRLMDLLRKLGSADHVDDVVPVYAAEGVAGALVEALRGVEDPEWGMSVVDMGLLRAVEVEGASARVEMTFTTRGCPLAGVMVGQVEDAARGLGLEPRVVRVFDPPWRPEHIAPEARGGLKR